MKHLNDPGQISVVARSPFHIYYEGKAHMVSAANDVGNFDILPGHTDFFSVMSPGKVLIETENDNITFSINNGIISVRDGEAILFVNI